MMKNVSEALKLVDEKKERLRQALLEIDSHSSSLSSFSVTWPDLDSRFSSIESSLLSQFTDLKSRLPYNPIAFTAKMKLDEEQPESSTIAESRVVRGGSSVENGTVCIEVRPEMKELCEKMDGIGLRKYIDDHHKELISIKKELSEALKFAEDPGLIVLDAIKGIYQVYEKPKRTGDRDVKDATRTCLVLLEELMNAVRKEGISGNAKEKAKNLAMEWKGKVSRNSAHNLEALGFLTLVATYDLKSEFEADEIAELFVETAKFRQAINLCRLLIMPDKIPDVVQKLIEADKQLSAVKFICELALDEKFPPVPLLKAYVNDVKQSATNVRNKGNHSRQAMNEAASKEINALRTVLKYIQDHKLGSEYPPRVLENRIEEIKRNKNNKKRAAAVMDNGKVQQQLKMRPKGQRPSGSKPSHDAAIATPRTFQTQTANIHSSMIHDQPAHLPTAGLMLDKNTLFVGSSVRPCGLAGSSNHNATPYSASSTVTPHMTLNPDVSGFSGSNLNVVQYPGNRDVASYLGSTPTVASYGSSVAGLYSTAGATVIRPAKPSPKSSNIYLPESQLPSAYRSTATAYGGYSIPPQYHPPYHPQ